MTQLNAAQRLTTIASTKVEATKTPIYIAQRIMPLFKAADLLAKYKKDASSKPLPNGSGAVLRVGGYDAGRVADEWARTMHKVCYKVTKSHSGGIGNLKSGGEEYTVFLSMKNGTATLTIQNNKSRTEV